MAVVGRYEPRGGWPLATLLKADREADEEIAMAGMKNQVVGKAHEIKGAITGDTGEEIGGKVRQVIGKIQSKVGRARSKPALVAKESDSPRP